MSQSELYRQFGIHGYSVNKATVEDQVLYIYVEPQAHRVCCSNCKSKNVIRRGSSERMLQSLPIGSKVTFVVATIPRVECRFCGLVRQINIGLADHRRSYTHAFERYALELVKHMTIKDAAEHLGVGWDKIKDIQKRYLQQHYSNPSLKDIRRIGIDEICVGRGYRFMTIVLDLDSGAILFAGKGKDSAALKPFWRRVRYSGSKIEAVAMDLSLAFQKAVRENLPSALVIFDRFHVIKLYNEKLTELRRDLHRQATEDLNRDVLKGTRWLLLKNHENLDPLKGEPGRLKEALKLNESLAAAYYLKDDLNQLWEQDSAFAAQLKMYDWYHQAMATGVRHCQQFARTLLAHAHGILAWYKHPISNGQVEGTNNKIKTMNRTHYGLRDEEFFKLKLYQLHETKYALVG
jgi:transposase